MKDMKMLNDLELTACFNCLATPVADHLSKEEANKILSLLNGLTKITYWQLIDLYKKLASVEKKIWDKNEKQGMLFTCAMELIEPDFSELYC
tara:strand:- start:88 stop:363 length:276 start_codon:yes stop_codon:yes gene_type:complete